MYIFLFIIIIIIILVIISSSKKVQLPWINKSNYKYSDKPDSIETEELSISNKHKSNFVNLHYRYLFRENELIFI